MDPANPNLNLDLDLDLDPCRDPDPDLVSGPTSASIPPAGSDDPAEPASADRSVSVGVSGSFIRRMSLEEFYWIRSLDLERFVIKLSDRQIEIDYYDWVDYLAVASLDQKTDLEPTSRLAHDIRSTLSGSVL